MNHFGTHVSDSIYQLCNKNVAYAKLSTWFTRGFVMLLLTAFTFSEKYGIITLYSPFVCALVSVKIIAKTEHFPRFLFH